MAVKHRPSDRGDRPLTYTYRPFGVEVPVSEVKRPVGCRPRTPAPDPDRTHKGPFEQLGTGRSVLAWRCLFLVSRFSVGLVPSNQSVLGDGLTGV